MDLATLAIRINTLELKQAASELEKLEAPAKRAEKATSSLESAAKKMAAALVAAFTLRAAISGLQSLVDAAGKFESAIVDMGKVTTQTAAEIKAAISGIDPSLGNSTQLVQGYYQVISAGVTEPKRALDTLTESSKLAKVAHTDQALVVKGVTALMEAYGASMKGAAGAGDLLLAMEAAGKTSVAELIPYIGELAGKSAALGVSQTDLAASFAQVSKLAGDTSVSATQLKALFTSLMAPTETLSKLFGTGAEGLGKFGSAQEAVQKIGFAKTLQLIHEAAGGSSEQMVKLLSSSESVAAMIAISANNFQGFNDAAQIAEDRTGKLTERFEAWKKSYEGQLETLKSNIENVKIALGDILLPVVTEIVGGFNDWFVEQKKLQDADLPNTLDAIKSGIKDVVDMLGPATTAAQQFYRALMAIKEFRDKWKPWAPMSLMDRAMDYGAGNLKKLIGVVDEAAPTFDFAAAGAKRFKIETDGLNKNLVSAADIGLDYQHSFLQIKPAIEETTAAVKDNNKETDNNTKVTKENAAERERKAAAERREAEIAKQAKTIEDERLRTLEHFIDLSEKERESIRDKTGGLQEAIEMIENENAAKEEAARLSELYKQAEEDAISPTDRLKEAQDRLSQAMSDGEGVVYWQKEVVKYQKEVDEAFRDSVLNGSDPFAGFLLGITDAVTELGKLGEAGAKLGEDFVFGLNESIGDSIYAAFTGDLDSIGDIWDSFLDSLLRSAIDFVAALASRAIFGGIGGILMGAFGSGGLLGGLGSALTGAFGGGGGVGGVAGAVGNAALGKAGAGVLGGLGSAAAMGAGNALWGAGFTGVGGALINAGTTSTVTTFAGAAGAGAAATGGGAAATGAATTGGMGSAMGSIGTGLAAVAPYVPLIGMAAFMGAKLLGKKNEGPETNLTNLGMNYNAQSGMWMPNTLGNKGGGDFGTGMAAQVQEFMLAQSNQNANFFQALSAQTGVSLGAIQQKFAETGAIDFTKDDLFTKGLGGQAGHYAGFFESDDPKQNQKSFDKLAQVQLEMQMKLAGESMVGQDIEKVLNAVGFVGTSQGWESKATLEFLKGTSESIGDDIQGQLEALGFVGGASGWESQATMTMIAEMGDQGVPWVEVEAYLTAGGMDAEQIMTLKTQYESNANFPGWEDFKAAAESVFPNGTARREIEALYHSQEWGTWNEFMEAAKMKGVDDEALKMLRANFSSNDAAIKNWDEAEKALNLPGMGTLAMKTLKAEYKSNDVTMDNWRTAKEAMDYEGKDSFVTKTIFNNLVNKTTNVPAAAGASAGGWIGYDGGGRVLGGSGLKDDLFAGRIGMSNIMLQGGEYVINKKSTGKYKPLLDWINYEAVGLATGGYLGFAAGGPVSNAQQIADIFLGLKDFNAIETINQNFAELRKELQELGATSKQLAKLEAYRKQALKDQWKENQDFVNSLGPKTEIEQINEKFADYIDQLKEAGGTSGQIAKVMAAWNKELAEHRKEVKAARQADIEALLGGTLGATQSKEFYSQKFTSLFNAAKAASGTANQEAAYGEFKSFLNDYIDFMSGYTGDYTSVVNTAVAALQQLMTTAKSAGGAIGYDGGGKVLGGSGWKDDLWAGIVGKSNIMLTGGEYVVNRVDAARNMALLETINSGRLRGYADGGTVGKPSPVAKRDRTVAVLPIHIGNKVISEVVIKELSTNRELVAQVRKAVH